MNKDINPEKITINIKITAIVVIALWAVILAMSILWNVTNKKDHTMQVLKTKSLALLNKDEALFLWIVRHEGIYVEPDKELPSDAYSKDTERQDYEITNSGKKLTLISPQHMLQEIMTEYAGFYSVKGHITSLKPLNPANSPDKWEERALKLLNKGVKEVSEITFSDNRPFFRLMLPLITKKACLKCHSHQGYEEGDIRGGIGIEIPIDMHLKLEQQHIRVMVISHVLIWLIGFIGILFVSKKLIKNILKTQLTESSLSKSETEFRLVFEDSNIGMYIVAPDGKIIKANKKMSEMFGYSTKELQTMDVNSFTHPDDFGISTGFINKALQGELGCSQFTKRYIHKNGSTVYGHVTTSIIKNSNNSPLYFVSQVQNITEQIHMEELLKKEKDFAERLVNTAQVIILVLDIKGRIIRFNPYMEQVSGYLLDEVKDKDWFDTFLPQRDRDVIRKLFVKAASDIRIIGNINPIVNKSGQERLIEWNGITLKDADNEIIGVLSIGQDITERYEYELKLEEKTKELETLNKNLEDRVKEEIEQRRRQEQLLIQQSKMAAMGEMIGAIAHQWRQPLNTISIIIQDVKDAYIYNELDTNYLKMAVDDIICQTKFMSKTIDDFKDFFKPSKEKSFFNLNTAVQESLNLLHKQLFQCYITVSLNCFYDYTKKTIKEGYNRICACEPELTCYGYPNEFKQVIINIINNARDAVFKNQIDNNLKEDETMSQIYIELHKVNDNSIIRIKDDAGGIPEDIMDKIFDPYFTTNKDFQGTGIGLYMSKVIIENNMGGKLYAQNINGGAMFVIELPCVDNKTS